MENSIKLGVFVQDYLIQAGLSVLANHIKEISSYQRFNSVSSLEEHIHHLDLLVVDVQYLKEQNIQIKNLKEWKPEVKILAITQIQTKTFYVNALEAGVDSYILNCCDSEEITEAIKVTGKGERFFCEKVLNEVMVDNKLDFRSTCEGLKISERESEIITLIAGGFTNKQIADKLFLSGHTITTHRKNIMNKLGVNNTAGIVMFAVKEKLVSPNKYLFSSNN